MCTNNLLQGNKSSQFLVKETNSGERSLVNQGNSKGLSLSTCQDIVRLKNNARTWFIW